MLSTITISIWSKVGKGMSRTTSERKEVTGRVKIVKFVKLDTNKTSPRLSSIVYIVSNFIQIVANISKITCWS